MGSTIFAAYFAELACAGAGCAANSDRVDPVTHILLGASLGYASFGGRIGRASALAGGLAAFAPDADVFIRSASDPLLAIEHHRGFTHALAFAPVGAAVVASLWLLPAARFQSWRARLRASRKSAEDGRRGGRPSTGQTHPPWPRIYAACLIGYVSHALLDATTSYGTQLLWPFSKLRAGWDLISIIDPLFTLALAIGLTWALVRQRLKPALVGLVVAAAYLGFGGVQHARAVAVQRDLAAARGHIIERFEVMPTLANNVVWRALYLHAGRIHSDRIRVDWFSRPGVREGWSLPQVRAADLLPAEKVRNTRRSFERFAWFSDDWVARSPANDRVLADMRYSLSADAFDPIWGIRFTEPGAPTEVLWVNRSRERQIHPGDLWSEITGGDERFGEFGATKR
jgi:inner membrane protein